MGYKFIRDITIEYPFYQRMAALLKGKKIKPLNPSDHKTILSGEPRGEVVG